MSDGSIGGAEIILNRVMLKDIAELDEKLSKRGTKWTISGV